MYKCTKCGDRVEELKVYNELRNFWGQTVYEQLEDEDCICGGYYEEMKSCECCGEYFTEDEFVGTSNLCDSCVKMCMTLELMEKYVNSDRKSAISFYMMYVLESDFTYSKISSTLLRICIGNFLSRTDNDKYKLLRDYILNADYNELDNFADFIEGEMNNEQQT